MLYKAIPASLAALLKETRLFNLPGNTYLAGGTATAIYLGHRISIDIDLFTEKNFIPAPIISEIKKYHDVTVTNLAEKNTLSAIIDGVKFSLFTYPYPLLADCIYNQDFDIYLASPIDIAAMKIVAINQRGTAKDFVDLKGLIENNNFSLNYLIEQVSRKYGLSENYSYQIRKGLVYFDDARNGLGDIIVVKDDRTERINKNDWTQIELFFKRITFEHK